MIKFKNFVLIKFFLIFTVIYSSSFADSHNIYDVLELIKKDLKTLEKAVYSESLNGNSNSASLSNNLDQNSEVNVVLEGHADERGTREYNLALGERRANAAKDYLMTYGISSNRISVISYGKERPVDSGSNPLAWSKNRRSVTVKAN